MASDGCNKESILWTRSSTWFALLMESFISSMALFIWSISLSKCGTLRVAVPLDWSLSALFSTPSHPKFWPHSPPCCWHNSWFYCVNSTIAAVMDYNYCWTIMEGGDARFGWLEAFPLYWYLGLVAIDLVRKMKPFCLGKGKEVYT